MSNATEETISDFIRDHHAAQTAFLAELVKVPSDNPPGDCNAHAKRAVELLEGIGFKVERHPVPEDVVRAHGMISATNLVIRERFGDGPVIACNAHADSIALARFLHFYGTIAEGYELMTGQFMLTNDSLQDYLLRFYFHIADPTINSSCKKVRVAQGFGLGANIGFVSATD